MGALCCRPIQQNKSPDYDQTTPDLVDSIIGQNGQTRYKTINGTRSFQESNSRKPTYQNTNQNRVNLSDLIKNSDQKQIRRSQVQNKPSEDGLRSSLHHTLPYDGQNPPTFQPARRSLLRTCKSGDTVLTFGKNLTDLESRLEAKVDGQDASYCSDNASPMSSPNALLNRSEPSQVITRKYRNPSEQSARKVRHTDSKESGATSAQYFSARERFSSEHKF